MFVFSCTQSGALIQINCKVLNNKSFSLLHSIMIHKLVQLKNNLAFSVLWFGLVYLFNCKSPSGQWLTGLMILMFLFFLE